MPFSCVNFVSKRKLAWLFVEKGLINPYEQRSSIPRVLRVACGPYGMDQVSGGKQQGIGQDRQKAAVPGD
jgi:hypothetical protein